MPEIRVKIYCFLCPETGKPVYVGKTSTRVSRRKLSHLCKARRNPVTPFHVWLSKNLNSNLVILDDVLLAESCKTEIRWIKRISRKFALLNVHKDQSNGNVGCGRIDWSPDKIARLGTTTDTELAKEFGCNRGTVSYRRECLGIKRFPDPHKVSTEVILDLLTIARLGLEPDYKIANDIGVSKFVIAKARKKKSIPSYAIYTGNNGRIKVGEAHRRWLK